MQSVVRKNRANAPLAYDIRDELSTTIATNPFDYDFSPTTLATFRQWLQTQYADLPALNREWERKRILGPFLGPPAPPVLFRVIAGRRIDWYPMRSGGVRRLGDMFATGVQLGGKTIAG